MQPRAAELPRSLEQFNRKSNNIGGGTTTGVLIALGRSSFGIPKEVQADKNPLFCKMILTDAPAAAAVQTAQSHEQASRLTDTIHEIKNNVDKLKEGARSMEAKGQVQFFNTQLATEEPTVAQITERRKTLAHEIKQLKEELKTQLPNLGTEVADAIKDKKTAKHIVDSLKQLQGRALELAKQIRDAYVEDRRLQKTLDKLRYEISTQIKISGIQQTTPLTTTAPASNTPSDSDMRKPSS